MKKITCLYLNEKNREVKRCMEERGIRDLLRTQGESRKHIGGHKKKRAVENQTKTTATTKTNNKTEKEDMGKVFEGVFQCLKKSGRHFAE